jgi:hypothetical protein
MYDLAMRRRGLTAFVELLMIVALLDGRVVCCQSTRPAPFPQKSEALKAALNQLEAEAREIIKSQRISLESPDFKSRSDQEIERPALLDAVTRPQHRDPFIDAYIRWQLTSFNPELPDDLDDRGFERLMQQAPAMIANPRADEGLVALFAQVEKQRPSDTETKRLRDTAAELDRRTDVAASFNRPAEQWREWLKSRFEGNTARQLHLNMERAAATIRAGWPSREVKAALTKSFKSAAADSALTDLDRRALAAHARTLIGLKRRSINEITFAADGSVSVTFSNAAISKNDVSKWLAEIDAEDE